MANGWIYQIMGQTFGPVSFPHLRDLAANEHLSPDDLIRRESDPDWVFASSVSGLFATNFPGPRQQPAREPERETHFAFDDFPEPERVPPPPPSNGERMPPASSPAAYDVGPVDVERKYPALRFCARLILWEAAVVFVLGTIFSLLILFNASPFEIGFLDRIWTSLVVWSGITIWCIAHVAGAESIMVWIDMEENGRRNNLLLRLLGKRL